MARRHALGQIVKKRRQLRFEADAGIGARDSLEILRAALLGEREARPFRPGQARDRRRHDLAEYPRALAAADHQHAQRPLRARRLVGSITQRRHRRAHRVAGDHLPHLGHILRPARRREAQRQAGGAPDDQPVGPAKHGILLVYQERDAQQRSGQADRHGGVAAECRDCGRPDIPQ